MKRTTAWICVSLLSLLLSSCGDTERPKFPVAKVVGTLSLDGQPIQKGRVQFVPVSPTPGAPVAGDVTSGKFEIADVPVGKHKVVFNATKETGKMITDRSEPYPEVVDLIPNQYRDGVDATVAGSESQQTFELTSK